MNKKSLNRFSYRLKYFLKYQLTFPFRWTKNFIFCLRYPFWKSRNVWTGKFLGYNSTWYDAIPKGWRKAFGKQLSKDIKKAIKMSHKSYPSINMNNAIQWRQIKEKYGTLRLYADTTHEVFEVLNKYEELSSKYCIQCGKPAEYVSDGWIEYLCEECFQPYVESNDFSTWQEYVEYKESCRIENK